MNASGIAGVLKDARDGHIPGFKGLAEWVIGLPGHLGKAGAAVRELGGMLAKGALPLSFIPATLGGLETHRKSPEKQTCLVFSFALLSLASGPRNLLDETSAVGVMQIFQAWGSVLGQGVELPWRRASG